MKNNKQNEIDLEMKEKNEEILKRWRDIGLLKGLKEGSQNEWRCAKSFELMANFLLEIEPICEKEIYRIICVLYFPIIRRIICRERPRVNRIVQPEEIHDAFLGTTLREAIDTLYDKGIIRKKKLSSKGKYALKIKDYYNLDYFKFIDAIDILNKSTDLNMLKEVFKIDIEAEFCVLFSKYLAVKLNETKNS